MPNTQRPLFDWTDLLPIAWLGLVIWAYLGLAAAPYSPAGEPVPVVAAADRAVVPLLALLLLTAIIRYFRRRDASGSAAADVCARKGAQDRP